jgi:transglutaminase-like putative cysteine protease
MDYKITHTTVYSYSETVPICHNEVHLTPREHPRQRRLASRLAVRPQPATVENLLDYFGNHVSFFTVAIGHERLTVTASSRVRVSDAPPPPALATPWEAVRDRLAVDRSPPYLEACQFAFDSPHVATFPALRAFAAESFLPGRPWHEAVLELTRRIHTDFRYDQTATNLSTPLEEVLKLRRGVCQDFAHLEIGCLRALGLPARYVSGYLVTSPPPGQLRLIGADASHAWVSAFSPDLGWMDVDPTNDQIPSTKHITLAWGRDYSDVAPIKGVFIGGGQHGMNVSVDVAPLSSDGDN